MPLDPVEVVSLSTHTIEVAAALSQALSKHGDGGAKITRAEARRLLRLLGQLVVELARDLGD